MLGQGTEGTEYVIGESSGGSVQIPMATQSEVGFLSHLQLVWRVWKALEELLGFSTVWKFKEAAL